ncbi:MAG: choice-of-anchor E domain-containing protein [Akkermansiaceae bacterium]|nr:choice-of-anchor E domain-containing protein [Akkermansiaceae bacterium]
MKSITTTATALALTALAASGATTGQLAPLSTNIPTGPGNPFSGMIGTFTTPSSVRVALPKFDTLLGTRVLTGVILRFEGSVQQGVQVENNNEISLNNFTATVDGSIRFFQDAGFDGVLTTEIATIANANGAPSPSITLAASDNGGVPNSSGPDFNNFGILTSGSTPLTVVNVPGSQFFGYIGLPGSEVYAFVRATTSFTTTGSGNVTGTTYDGAAIAGVTVEYTYDDVIPEPSSVIALGGLMALGLGARNRRRK